MTELVVVIVIAGILAATMVPRWGGDTGFEVRGFRDEVASALRYAQKSAVASRRRVCVSFAADALSVTIDSSFGANDCALVLNGASGDPLVVTAEGGAGFAVLPSSLAFDPLGRPSAALVLQFSNLPGLPVTVEAETGYVH